VEPIDDVPPEPAVTADEMERRQFVRRMSTDAVGIAGRVFGLSKALSRGVVAGGQAMRDNLEAVALAESDAQTAGEEGAAPVEPPEVASPAPPAEPAATSTGAQWAAPRPIVAPPVRLTDQQRAILAAATSAVLAVNGREAAPTAVPVPIHWDGETIRFASLGWSRRSAAIRTDPRVTLVVQDPDSATFLTIEGRAEFIVGAGVRTAMAPLLSAAGDEAEAEARWTELVAADIDRVVVTVSPERVLPGRL
jgi:nitroimidazol reductase NimA-like FMN-containing flavoprotein (pyridoxamine 5'-phosphate oxidase superfamily)